MRYLVVTEDLKSAASTTRNLLADIKLEEGALMIQLAHVKVEDEASAARLSRHLSEYARQFIATFPNAPRGSSVAVARERLRCGPVHDSKPALAHIFYSEADALKAGLGPVDEMELMGICASQENLVLSAYLLVPDEIREIIDDLVFTRRPILPIRSGLVELARLFSYAYHMSPPIRIRGYVFASNPEAEVTTVEFEDYAKRLHDLHEHLPSLAGEIARMSRQTSPHYVIIAVEADGDFVVSVDGAVVNLEDRPLRALLALAMLRKKDVFLATTFAGLYSEKTQTQGTKATKDAFYRPLRELAKALPRIEVDEDAKLKRAGKRRVSGLHFQIGCTREELEKALNAHISGPFRSTVKPGQLR